MNPKEYCHPCVILPRDSHSRSQHPLETICLARIRTLHDRIVALKDKVVMHQSSWIWPWWRISKLQRHRYFISIYFEEENIVVGCAQQWISLRISLNPQVMVYPSAGSCFVRSSLEKFIVFITGELVNYPSSWNRLPVGKMSLGVTYAFVRVKTMVRILNRTPTQFKTRLVVQIPSVPSGFWVSSPLQADKSHALKAPNIGER